MIRLVVATGFLAVFGFVAYAIVIKLTQNKNNQNNKK